MIRERLCPCRDGRCECDACWSMRAATGGKIKASPECERCAHPPATRAGGGDCVSGDAVARRRPDPVAGVRGSYAEARAKCPPGGAIRRAAYPACAFAADHPLPLDARVPRTWKTARDWRVEPEARA